MSLINIPPLLNYINSSLFLSILFISFFKSTLSFPINDNHSKSLINLNKDQSKYFLIDDDELDDLIIWGLISIILILILISIIKTIKKYGFIRSNRLQLINQIPGSFDDEFEIEERLSELSPNEQNLYRAGQEFIKKNPPYLEELSLTEHLLIQEKGIEAWEFIPNINLMTDSMIQINNKTEINFLNFDYQCSIQTNLPIPKINDVYYYEAKIYQLNSQDNDNNDNDDSNIISIGLSTKQYPYFRLPGRHLYSISYDSNGSRRYSNSFKLSEGEAKVFPKLIKGDVIGIGYRVRSGTVFFTRNGKKLSEKSIGGHIKGFSMNNIYPTIGANNPCSIHINLGQLGYVFIEANIKKWGYASKEGLRPPLPSYNYSSNDLLLESSNEDDDEMIINPPDFFKDIGYQSEINNFKDNSSSNNSIDENFTLRSIELPKEPPIYLSEEDDDDEDDDEENLIRNTMNNQFLSNYDVGEDGDNEEEQ
ncbi:hypothetical protein WICMUC_003134 [Wickerhamomyces mucosus]|uniref:B30.2/SPRY domain-containing protein n=1 Tax=Wickerhamomyces mucosus TaxID=1378264 RepID=A0A9P8PLY5_9ASCO|nr:hypothetical protein WICMUC_003134 [Wickerhamomyces mucosus]